MLEKVLVISDDERTFNFIESSLGSEILTEKWKMDDNEPEENFFQFIFLACQYQCVFTDCLRKFLFLLKKSETPFAIIRPILLEKSRESGEGFLLSFFKQYELSTSQKDIIKKIKRSKYYGCSPNWGVHPSNTLFKIVNIQKTIVENPASRFNFVQFAELVNLNYSWCSMRFKELTGKTLERFLMQIKFCYSLWEIISTDKRIKLIARDAGYKDPLSFAKRFKFIFGMSPSLIRKGFNSILHNLNPRSQI